MKYLLILFLAGCTQYPILKLKYGDIVYVNDSFYGEGICETEKYIGEDYYQFFCRYDSGFRSSMVYKSQDVKIPRLESKGDR